MGESVGFGVNVLVLGVNLLVVGVNMFILGVNVLGGRVTQRGHNSQVTGVKKLPEGGQRVAKGYPGLEQETSRSTRPLCWVTTLVSTPAVEVRHTGNSGEVRDSGP